MNSLNRKTIIKICNIACIALTALLIILQFIPLLHNVGDKIWTRSEFNQLLDDKSAALDLNIPGVEMDSGMNNTLKAIIKEVTAASIGKIVWDGPFLGMQAQHIPILLFGVLGIILSIININSTLSGVPLILVILSGLKQISIVPVCGIVSILLIPFTLALCGLHIWKIYTWCTVKEDQYHSMWGVR